MLRTSPSAPSLNPHSLTPNLSTPTWFVNLSNWELNPAQHLDLEPKPLRGQLMVVWTWAPTRRILTREGPPRRACHYRPLLRPVFVVHFRPALPSFSRPSRVPLREREEIEVSSERASEGAQSRQRWSLRVAHDTTLYFFFFPPLFVCWDQLELWYGFVSQLGRGTTGMFSSSFLFRWIEMRFCDSVTGVDSCAMKRRRCETKMIC